MKALKYIPLLVLCSCTSTRVTDNSKHYSYNSSNHQVKNDVQQSYPSQSAPDEVLYRQTDQDYANSSPSVVRPYTQQNYAPQPYNRPQPVMAYAGFEGFNEHFFERSNPKRNFRPVPPNVVFRKNEYNPYAY